MSGYACRVEIFAKSHWLFFARHVATRRGGFAPSFLNNNRNKRSVALDLKADEGIAALKAIIATNDASISSL